MPTSEPPDPAEGRPPDSRTDPVASDTAADTPSMGTLLPPGGSAARPLPPPPPAPVLQ
jgi:hypothetical protein